MLDVIVCAHIFTKGTVYQIESGGGGGGGGGGVGGGSEDATPPVVDSPQAAGGTVHRIHRYYFLFSH